MSRSMDRPLNRSRNPLPTPLIVTRSDINVVRATAQPAFTSPSRAESGRTTLSKKTSLNSASPVIWRSGRTVTPGASRSATKYGRPRCFGRSGAVLASNMPRLATSPKLVHVFCPLMIQSSTSRLARVASDDRSEPAPGSLKSWHHVSSFVAIFGRRSFFC